VERIYKRDLYKFVDEIMIPQSMLPHLNKDTVRVEDILSYQDSGDDLRDDDIIIDWLKINYALKDKNPVDNVKFFSRYNDCGRLLPFTFGGVGWKKRDLLPLS